MNNLYSITLQRTKEKYLKFKNRLEKSISSGRFNSLSRKSKNRLVSRVDKYKSKIEEVNLAVKGSLVAGSVLAASVIPQDAIAKDERSEFDRGALSFDNEELEEILNPIKEAIAKRNTFKIDESVAGLNDLDGDGNNKFFATGGLAVSLVNFTENNANRGDIIGVLVAQDLGGYGLSPDGITFSFATGDGTNDADNAKFEIVNNNQLIVAAATTLDFETQNSFNLFINVDDGDIPADYAITMYMENSPEQGVGTFDKTGEQLSTFRMNNGSTADLDGDGIEELIFTGREDKYSGTRIFVQNIGIGGDPVQVYSTGSIARAADIDGDGDLDLVVGVSNYLRLLQNDGSGNFTYYNSVAYSFGSVYDIEVADFDQNGKVDFAVAGSSNTRVLLDNGSAMSVANSGTVYDLSVGDFDQDGFPDLAFIDGYNAVAIRENVDGSYFSFTTSSYQNSPRKVEFSDIDGDGDDDVIAVGYDIITLTNYGGSFSGSSSVYLSSYLYDKDHIAIVDIDGDGDDDLVVNTYVYSNNFEDSYTEITVHTNVGGVFSTAQSFQSDIDNQGIRTLFAGDIDSDDDLDIIIGRDVPNNAPSGGDDYQVLVFENRNVAPYISSFNGKVRLDENQSPGTLGSFTFYDPNGESITAVPFDGDNDNDLFSYSDSDLSLVGNVDWEEVGSSVTFQFELGDGYSTRVEDVTFTVNNLAEAGSGTFESEPVPLFGKQRSRHAISGDFDNDGDQDLMKVSFTSGGEGIEVILPLDSQFPNSMFNQIEDGTFIEEPIYDLSSRLDAPLFVDFDNDGDLDLIGETQGGEANAIARLENKNGVFDRRNSYGNNYEIDFMQVGDFDNDGVTELVILETYFQDRIIVFDIQDGGEMSQTDNFYTNSSGSYIVTDNIVNLEVGDINGDGFDDLLLTVTNGGDDVMIPGGEFGLNTSLATSVITDPDYGSIISKLVDIDGDGDLDIVLHTVYDDSNYNSEIDIHLNDGSGYFTQGDSFLTGGENGGALALGDIDGDGSPDLVTISGSNSGGNYTSYLKIWTNDGSGTFTLSQELQFEDGLGDQLSLMDVDGDDDNDIIFEYNKYTVALINANVAPTAIVLSGTSFDEHLAIDSEVATLSATDANALDTHTFSLVEGDGSNDLHNGYFRIDGNSLQIIKDAKFEDTPQLFINLEATDDSGASVTEAFILTVNDVNQAPTAITLSTSSLDENTQAGSAVATIDATDANAADEHTFTLVAGDGSNDADNDKFVVEGDQLIIKQASSFETQSSYNIYLSAADSEGSVAQAFTLTVNNTNEVPTAITLSASSLDENTPAGSAVATIDATDVNASDEHTFSLVAGDGSNDADNDKFVVEGDQLIIKQASSFETQSSYNIYLSAADSEGSVAQAFTLTVNNTNEVPTAITLSASSLDENTPAGSAVATIDATDVNASDEHTFSLVAGDGSNDADNDKFVVEGDQLIIKQASSFETQSSYNIYLSAADSEGSVAQAFTLAVNNTNEVPTAITLSASSLDENTPAGSAVATIDATDVNASDEHTFSLVAGDGSNDADNNKFVVEGDQLIIKQASSFETQSSYNIYLSAADSEGSVAQAFTLTVNNTNEAPTAITLSASSLDENTPAGSAVATIDATDVNASDEHTFSLVAGDGSNDADNNKFVVEGDQLIIKQASSFETQSSYNIYLSAADSEGSVAQAFTLTVNNTNEAPTAITLSASSLDENTPAGSAVATIDATDVNASDEHTFSLVAGDGSNDRDNNKFVVEGDQLIIKQASRFETQANYNIYLSASDNEGSVAQAFVLSVIDVNQAPTSISLSITSIDESVSPGSTVALISATDPNAGDSPTFALVEGDGTNDSHNDMFVIVENKLILIDEIEFNDLQSININIQADDGEETFEQTFTLVVNEVLGLSDEISNTLGVYPNPGNDRFQINFENNVRGAVTIKVSDLSGKVVHSISSFKDQMEFVHSIDMSSAEAGIYLIELITVREVITQRWIKK